MRPSSFRGVKKSAQLIDSAPSGLHRPSFRK